MKSKVILKHNEEILAVDEQLVSLEADKIEERVSNFDFGVVEGEEKEISLNGIKVYFGNLKIGGSISLDVKYETPFLMITFELEGETTFTPKNKSSKNVPITIKSNEYNFFYMTDFEGTVTYNSDHRKYFSLFFTEDYVKNMFKSNFDLVSADFGTALREKTSFLMFQKSQKIPYKLLEIINDIKDCCYQNEIKEIFIQSKITEIFAYLFAEFNTLRSEKSKLKARDLELVKKAEMLISENITSTITLDELSKQIGSNKFKLKKDFKLIFDESVFAYQKRLRMEKAKELLTNSDSTISEVSYAVGYKNPQHFTSAFKKQFDCLPSIFRKRFIK